MAKNQTRRLPSGQLTADREAFDALQGITNYAPANPAYTTAIIRTLHDSMDTLQREATQAQADADARRDDLIAGEWAFHNAMLGVKVQVDAQFGDSSNEVASLGIKKKSEYKKPSRNKKGGGGTK